MSTAGSGSGDATPFVTVDGVSWEARVVSHGRTSTYLNARVHRPIVEFTCTDAPTPRRYAALPVNAATLGDLDSEALRILLQRARAH